MGMSATLRPYYGLLFLAIAAAACGDASGPELTPRSLAVELSASVVARVRTDESLWPFQECDVDLRAAISGEGTLVWQGGSVKWFIGANRSAPADEQTLSATEVRDSWDGTAAPGSTVYALWTVWASLPFEIEMTFHYLKQGESQPKPATVRVTCGPPLPAPLPPGPTISAFTAPQQTFEPGDTVRAEYAASSGAGLWVTRLMAEGAMQASWNHYEARQTSVSRLLAVPFLRGAPTGIATKLTAIAIDPFGQSAEATANVLPLSDQTPPVIRTFEHRRSIGSGYSSDLSGKYFLGDTVVFYVMAEDNGLTHSVVWEIMPGGERDSLFLVPYPTALVDVKIPVRPSWEGGTDVYFTVWIRDAAGNISEPRSTQPGAFRFYPSFDRPRMSANLDSEIGQVLPDTVRGVLYALQPNRSRVAVLSLADLSTTAMIALPAAPSAMDMTRGGDSLLVVIPSLRALSVVDLRQSPPEVTQLPLAMPDTATWQTPARVSTTSRGTAIVTFPSGGSTNWLPLEIDLANGQQRFRDDATGSGLSVALGRSGDRSLLLLSSATCIRLYDAPTDTFAECHPSDLLGPASVDIPGDRFVLNERVYDAGFNRIGTIESPVGTPGIAALTPNGEHVYHSYPFIGLVRSRASDGAIVDRTTSAALYPESPQVTADGRRLIYVGGHGFAWAVNVVDLDDGVAQPTVPTASSLRAVATQRSVETQRPASVMYQRAAWMIERGMEARSRASRSEGGRK